MFERFTEKAINAVIESQSIAKELYCPEVLPEHLLLALIKQAKGVSLKIFRMYGLDSDIIKKELTSTINNNKTLNENIIFSNNVKNILKRTLDLASKSGNQNILFEHLFLALITDKNIEIQNILDKFNFDINSTVGILTKLVHKKIKKLEHPEELEDDLKNSFESIYEGEALTGVLENAVSKLSTKGYEILGTEQIMASILESSNTSLINTLKDNGISIQNFDEKLNSITSRQSEFEDKKIIFTPNAFLMMNMAFQTAKELGSSAITPEHIVLSILKSKKGLAYDIINDLGINKEKLIEDIIKPIEKQMPETLLIMKLAKEEARRLGRNIVGTEMFLLGIIGEGASIASEVLNNLEVTIKDARLVVETLVGFGNEYFEKEVTFTNRAKRVLEKAWGLAKKQNKQKIEASDLLLAILEEPNSLAMKVLDNLGVDSMEIKQGIQRLTC